MSQDNNSSGVNRRSLLKQFGTASAGVVSLVGVDRVEASDGTVSARSETEFNNFEKAMEFYGTVEQRYDIVREQADDLLVELSDRDILPEADPKVLPLENVFEGVSSLAPSDEREGVGMTYIDPPEQTETALLTISKTTEEYHLTVYVQPEAGRRYALVQPTDGGSKFAIDPSFEDGKLVKSSSCDNYTRCGSKCQGTCPCPGPAELYHELQMDCYIPNMRGECECFVEGSTCGGGDCWSTCTIDCEPIV